MIKLILRGIIGVIVFYLLGYFISLESNPIKWDEDGKLCFVLVVAIWFVICLILKLDD